MRLVGCVGLSPGNSFFNLQNMTKMVKAVEPYNHTFFFTPGILYRHTLGAEGRSKPLKAAKEQVARLRSKARKITPNMPFVTVDEELEELYQPRIELFHSMWGNDEFDMKTRGEEMVRSVLREGA